MHAVTSAVRRAHLKSRPGTDRVCRSLRRRWSTSSAGQLVTRGGPAGQQCWARLSLSGVSESEGQGLRPPLRLPLGSLAGAAQVEGAGQECCLRSGACGGLCGVYPEAPRDFRLLMSQENVETAYTVARPAPSGSTLQSSAFIPRAPIHLYGSIHTRSSNIAADPSVSFTYRRRSAGTTVST